MSDQPSAETISTTLTDAAVTSADIPKQTDTTPKVEDTKGFDEARVSALIADAKAKAAKQTRKELEDQLAEEKRLANLSAQEQLTELQNAQKAKDAAHEQQLLSARREAKLYGIVEEPDQVLALIQLAGVDDYFDGETPKVEVITEKFKRFVPQVAATKASGGAPPPGGLQGGQVKDEPDSLAAAINQAMQKSAKP